MGNKIDPYEIRTIESNTPITIRMEDGSTFIAYNFEFIDKESVRSRDGDYNSDELEVVTNVYEHDLWT